MSPTLFLLILIIYIISKSYLGGCVNQLGVFGLRMEQGEKVAGIMLVSCPFNARAPPWKNQQNLYR